MTRTAQTLSVIALLAFSPAASAGEPNEMFWVRATAKAPACMSPR
jgi:hypothetical protein